MKWTRRAPGDYVSLNLEYTITHGPIGWELRYGSTLLLIADTYTDAKWYAQAHADGEYQQIADAIELGYVFTQADLDKWGRK